MTHLLDTNVVSELIKEPTEPRVEAWIRANESDLYVSAAMFAELERGVHLMPAGRRRNAFAQWVRGALQDQFRGRILPIDEAVAAAWGILMARSKRQGAELDPMDAFFAATAYEYNLILVTRNIRHFTGLDIPLINPWDDAP